MQKQIEELQRKAEKLRQQEIAGVISRIKVAIAHYDLTAEQLGYSTSSKRKGLKPGRSPASGSTARYADGQGKTWSGRGPRPGWLRDALAAGSTLEQLQVASSGSTVETVGAKSSPKKRVSKVSYKDDAGHSWSGFGPRPQWLKDALESGRALEELAA
jgi:DNA-binding protein H-NS